MLCIAVPRADAPDIDDSLARNGCVWQGSCCALHPLQAMRAADSRAGGILLAIIIRLCDMMIAGAVMLARAVAGPAPIGVHVGGSCRGSRGWR
jgi:hypothetical protein